MRCTILTPSMEATKDIFIRSACTYFCCYLRLLNKHFALWKCSANTLETLRTTCTETERFHLSPKDLYTNWQTQHCIIISHCGKTAITPCNQVVFLHLLEILQIFSSSNDNNLRQKPRFSNSMFIEVSMTEVSKSNKYLLITFPEPATHVWSPIPSLGWQNPGLSILNNVSAFPSVEKMKVIVTSFLKIFIEV